MSVKSVVSAIRQKFRISPEDYAHKLEAKGQDPATGHEIPDDVPMQPAVGFVKQDSMVERVRSMVASELLRRHAEAEGFDTFEEADDFDVGDDFEPDTPYEAEFEPVQVVVDREAKARAEAEKLAQETARAAGAPPAPAEQGTPAGGPTAAPAAPPKP